MALASASLPEQGTSKHQDNICLECQAVFNSWYERNIWYKRGKTDILHHTIMELENCICPICKIFFDSFSDEARQSVQTLYPLVKSTVQIDSDASIALRRENWTLTLEYSGHLSDPIYAGYILVFPASLYSKGKAADVQPVTDCKANWQLILNWVQTCMESHPTCAQRQTEFMLPTRLISVGTTDEDIKIVPSRLLPPGIDYVTLSHCWGEKLIMTLTKSNYSDLLTKIPAAALTKTFREACYITRRLGIKYLWIDSLCIRQGDEADWQHESALMVEVYSNAAVNIAAADAPDGDTGLFFERESAQTLAWTLPVPISPKSLETILWNCAPITLNDSNSLCVLHSRAWAYQERFLAPRTLQFEHTHIGWSCRTMEATEFFPEFFKLGTTSIARLSHELLEQPNIDVANAWLTIIFQYSGRKLTFRRDKLVAISGVARLLASRFGPRYLAGLWEKNMTAQLMWMVMDLSTSYDQSMLSYRAPSWSWASMDNPAIRLDVLREANYQLLAEVVKAETTFPVDQFGEVSGGYIRLRYQVLFRGSIGNWKHSFDCEISVEGLTTTGWMINPDRAAAEIEGEIYFVPILKGVNGQNMEQIGGLILKEIAQDKYCRVGSFAITRSKAINDFQRSLSRNDNRRGGVITIV